MSDDYTAGREGFGNFDAFGTEIDPESNGKGGLGEKEKQKNDGRPF
jgi:hypothetical protein